MAASGSTEHLVQLTQQALDTFDQVPVSTSARRALRIARLRGDAATAWLLARELHPTGGSRLLSRSDALRLWEGQEESVVYEQSRALAKEWILERQASVPEALKNEIPNDAMLTGSIDEIESRIKAMDISWREETDAVQRAQLFSRLSMEAEVISRIRYRVFSYLCHSEQTLALSEGAASIFDRYRTRVEALLTELAPEVLEQLNAAYRRTQEHDAEARAHALTSCRRMLKSVADVVFAPRDEPFRGSDGQVHAVGSERYLARLWAFLDTTTGPGGTARRLTAAALKDVGGRLDRLNDLGSKGVHDEVAQAEVDLCVLHSFLIAGEILRLHALANAQGHS